MRIDLDELVECSCGVVFNFVTVGKCEPGGYYSDYYNGQCPVCKENFSIEGNR